MNRFVVVRYGIAIFMMLGGVSASVRAQTPTEEFTNLLVLPNEIAPDDLREIMRSYTRALGVRCTYCHVGERGKPHQHGDFAKDDKPTKTTAREMMRMTNDLNQKYLAALSSRSEPSIRVQCVTCHHGVTEPRTLQEILEATYEIGGMDSTLARYQALYDRYFGRFSYDFGDVPLADVASRLHATGHPDDAERLLALDVEMNPESSFAKREHADVVLARAFTVSADSGAAAYRDLRERYGAELIGEAFLNHLGYDLLEADQIDEALAAFVLNVAENPESANAHDSLGEVFLRRGDRKQAIAAYETSLELDPSNDNAVEKLRGLGVTVPGSQESD